MTTPEAHKITAGSLVVSAIVLAVLLGLSYAGAVTGMFIAVLGAGGTMDPHRFAERVIYGILVLDAAYLLTFAAFLCMKRPYAGIMWGLGIGAVGCWVTWVVGLWVLR